MVPEWGIGGGIPAGFCCEVDAGRGEAAAWAGAGADSVQNQFFIIVKINGQVLKF